MGFNTVAFLLNDMMDSLEKNPKTTVYALTHPKWGNDEEKQDWRRAVDRYADSVGEPGLHTQALELMPTWHADGHKWFFAGGNMIREMKFLKYGSTKEGKLTVTLELPEKWFDHPKTRKSRR